MRPIRLDSPAAVAAASGDDGLLVWAAQGLRPGTLAWCLGDAVAVAARDLSRRDRLAVNGPLLDAAELVAYALGVVGATYRPIGEAALIRAIAVRLPSLVLVSEFDWMECTSLATESAADRSPAWCTRWLGREAMPVVARLLDDAFPESQAHPRQPGFRRWAGASLEPAGPPAAVAADAWSTRGLGFVAGVATAANQRGKGAGHAVTRFVTAALLGEEGRVALMVDADNAPAIAVYKRIGFVSRPLAAARVRR